MRTSQSRTGPRLLSAGIATVATAAAVLAGTATPALAVAPTVTVAPAAGSNTGTITATSNAFLNGVTAPATIFSTSACADPYASSTSNITATTTKTSDDVATITVPTTITLNSGAARTYYVCVYNGTVAGTSVLKGQGTYVIAPVATPTVTSGASGGGNTLTVNLPSTSAVFSTSSVATTFASGGCPATYGSPTVSATATKVTTTQVTVPVPAGVGGPDGTKFAICFYAGTSSSSALIAASSATAYTVTLPAVTLEQHHRCGQHQPEPGQPHDHRVQHVPDRRHLAGRGGDRRDRQLHCALHHPGAQPRGRGPQGGEQQGRAHHADRRHGRSGVSTDSRSACTAAPARPRRRAARASSMFTCRHQPPSRPCCPAPARRSATARSPVTGSTSRRRRLDHRHAGRRRADLITPLDPNTFTAVTPAHAVGNPVAGLVHSAGHRHAAERVHLRQQHPGLTQHRTEHRDGSGCRHHRHRFPQLHLQHQRQHRCPRAQLVNGVYNGNTGTGNSVKANGPVADCGFVLVISDNELICSLNLTAALDAAGAAVVANGYHTSTAATTASNNIVSCDRHVHQADVGKVIAESGDTDIPANTTIAAVLSPDHGGHLGRCRQHGPGHSSFAVTIGYQSGSISATGSNTNYTLTRRYSPP